jgi:hypothetical protein
LATYADAFSQDASFVGIDNEGIGLIQQVRCLVEAARLHQKFAHPALSRLSNAWNPGWRADGQG